MKKTDKLSIHQVLVKTSVSLIMIGFIVFAIIYYFADIVSPLT
jgi:hypothetical protein